MTRGEGGGVGVLGLSLWLTSPKPCYASLPEPNSASMTATYLTPSNLK